jgi:hypothetical protein
MGLLVGGVWRDALEGLIAAPVFHWLMLDAASNASAPRPALREEIDLPANETGRLSARARHAESMPRDLARRPWVLLTLAVL